MMPEFDIRLETIQGEDGEEYWGSVEFVESEFENVRLSLGFNGATFMVKLLVYEYTDESYFRYSFEDDAPLAKVIPEALKDMMGEVAMEQQPLVFKPGQIR
jgi:hypothetical protein